MALSAQARDRVEGVLYDELQEAGELRGTIVAKHEDGTFDVAMASATRPPKALRVPLELLRPVGLEHRKWWEPEYKFRVGHAVECLAARGSVRVWIKTPAFVAVDVNSDACTGLHHGECSRARHRPSS